MAAAAIGIPGRSATLRCFGHLRHWAHQGHQRTVTANFAVADSIVVARFAFIGQAGTVVAAAIRESLGCHSLASSASFAVASEVVLGCNLGSAPAETAAIIIEGFESCYLAERGHPEAAALGATGAAGAAAAIAAVEVATAAIAAAIGPAEHYYSGGRTRSPSSAATASTAVTATFARVATSKSERDCSGADS